MRQPVCHTVLMSIERLQHLRFPADLGPVVRSNGSASADAVSLAAVADAPASQTNTAEAKAAAPRLTARVPTLSDRIEPGQVSVIVTLQSDTQVQEPAPESIVYGNARKAPVPANDEADLAAMEVAYQRAQERTANAVTALKVDASGIVVARQPDFVSVAVSAMREFKDEADRQKRYAQAENTSLAHETPSSPNALRGLQHLAARFKLFA